MMFKHAEHPSVRWMILVSLAGLMVSAVLPGCKRQAPTPPARPTRRPEPVEPVEPQEPVYERQFGLEAYPTEHYLLYSSAPDELKADVAMRLEVIHDEYRREMADVFASSDEKAKAFFIGDPGLFVEAGGVPGPPGIFRVLVNPDGSWADSVGPRLILRNSGDSIYLEVTSLLQHEGWHQFNWHHVRQWAPIWFDEGLATYYSYGLWTGDRMLYGGINPTYFQLLGESIPGFVSLTDLLHMGEGQWAAWEQQVSFWPRYMQSFSVIQFLKHADGGAHEPVLKAYIADVAAGRDATASIDAIVALEGRWAQWLQTLPQTYTHGTFFEAIAATLAGHLARCQINGQKFDSMADFLAAADAGQLKLGPIGSDTWLPASVMAEYKRYMDILAGMYGSSQYGAPVYELEVVDGAPTALVKLDSIGLHLRGVATVSGGRVTDVTVQGLETIQPAMR